MTKKWNKWAGGLSFGVLLILEHHFQTEATDVFFVVCLIALCWVRTRHRRPVLYSPFLYSDFDELVVSQLPRDLRCWNGRIRNLRLAKIRRTEVLFDSVWHL
jgi:hypothetical protein